MANDFKTTEVDSRGRAIYKNQDGNFYYTIDPKTGEKIKGGNAPVTAPTKSNAPVSFQQETPASNISAPSKTTQFLPQYVKVLQNAVSEASQQRQFNLATTGISAVAGGGQLAPGVSGTIINMVRGAVGPAAEQVFGSAVSSVSESIRAEEAERNFQFKIQESQRALVSDLARDGALSGMSTDALSRLGESAGIDSNILISWKARLQEADELEKSDAELKRRQIEVDIENTLDTIRERQEPDKGGGSDDEAAVELMSKDAFIRREQEKRQQTLSPNEANRLYEDYVANNSVSGDEAELIQLALAGLKEEDRQAYNLLGTKEAKEQLILRGLGIKSGVTSSKPISQSGRTP